MLGMLKKFAKGNNNGQVYERLHSGGICLNLIILRRNWDKDKRLHKPTHLLVYMLQLSLHNAAALVCARGEVTDKIMWEQVCNTAGIWCQEKACPMSYKHYMSQFIWLLYRGITFYEYSILQKHWKSKCIPFVAMQWRHLGLRSKEEYEMTQHHFCFPFLLFTVA